MKLKKIMRIGLIGILSALSCIFSCKKVEVPTIETIEVSGITDNSALSGGNVQSDGGSLITEKGICWKKGGVPTIEDNLVINSDDSLKFTSLITGLDAGFSYGIRAYAKNSTGIGYGDPVYFTTYPRVPFISDVSVSDLTKNSATLTGHFTFGPGLLVFSTGLCYSLSPNPDLSKSFVATDVVSDTVRIKLSELYSNTVYYVRLCVLLRLYGTTNYYAVYGNETSFRTKPISVAPTIKDIMGNVYSTLQLGNQVWLRENLRVSVLNDGSQIQKVTDKSAWYNLSTPGYCWYANTQDTIFGALYNWNAVKTGKLCPSGWHAPSVADWQELIGYFGGLSIAPTKFIDKQIGFNALSGGCRDGIYTLYQARGINGYWWSTTNVPKYGSYAITLKSDGNTIGLSLDLSNERSGYSVRCVKD